MKMNGKTTSKVIVDTCIWIEFFQTKSETSNSLKKLISGDFVVGTGIILAELLQGAKTNKEREILVDIFNTIEYIEITKEIWIESGNLARELRSQGKTIPLSDVTIACCAMKYNYSVFSVDKHFQDIPNIQII
ncbi:MAG: type II toxin-antitoxin system VapC family toxin [Candidatus Anammoxibacter sp.]